MLRIIEVNDRRELVRFREPWRELAARAPESDLFQTYEWLTAWLEFFWRDRPIAFLFAFDADRLVGLAPLVHDSDREVSCPDSLSLPVNGHARRSDLLLDAEPQAVLDAVLDHLRRAHGGLRLTLRQSLAKAKSAVALGQVAGRHGLITREMADKPSLGVRISGSWEGYLASLSEHNRREMKRKLKKLEREHQPAWSIITTAEQYEAERASLVRIERRSWKEEEGTSLISEGHVMPFYDAMARSFAAAGWLRMYLLRLGGEPVAHIFGAEYRREYFAFKTSYDQAFRTASPGIALFQFALRDAFARQLLFFDFLGDPSRWKSELSNAAREQTTVCASSRFDPYCHWCALCERSLRPALQGAAEKVAELKDRFFPVRPPAPVPAPTPAPVPAPVPVPAVAAIAAAAAVAAATASGSGRRSASQAAPPQANRDLAATPASAATLQKAAGS